MHIYIKLLVLMVVLETVLTDNCHFNDPRKKMTDSEKERACARKARWEADMNDPHKKKLTPREIAWLNSLSSLNGGGRGKRQTSTPKLRKEYRDLSDNERNAFHEAVVDLYTSGNYASFVTWHSNAVGAHWGAGFGPFHREFLSRFENALRVFNPSVSLPYLDSRLDGRLGLSQHFSILWTNSFLGNRNGPVTSGPFANFDSSCNVNSVISRAICVDSTRGKGQSSSSSCPTLYSDADVNDIESLPDFASTVICVDSTFELTHGDVHTYVGGDMNRISCSPGDPTFFLHHAFVDFLWERARDGKPNKYEDYPLPEEISPDEDRICFMYPYGKYDPMTPLNDTLNVDGIGSQYIPHLYDYADSPGDYINCGITGCNSNYLWCMSNGRCAAKKQTGGSCTRHEECLSNSCVEVRRGKDKGTSRCQ